MADFLVKGVPLPIPRPSGLFSEYEPFTVARMPLEASEKAADAFSGGGWYTPTSQGIKLTSELLMAFKRHMGILGEKVMELNDFGFWVIALVVVSATFVGGFFGIQYLVSKVCGNK